MALHVLRLTLASGLLALGLLAAVPLPGLRSWQEQTQRELADRALQFVTTSDIVPVRLTPAPGLPEATHGTYRGRPTRRWPR